MTAKLMKRDRDLIGALSTKVRVLTFEQAMRGWWARTEDPKGTVARRLRTLHAEGHLVVFDAQGPDPSLPSDPLLTWSPGEPEPDIDVALNAARQRAEAPPKKQRLVTSTRSVAEALGATGVLAHELQFAEVFMRCFEPSTEWQMHPRGEALPATWASLDDGVRVEVAHHWIRDTLESCRINGSALKVW